MDSSVGICGAGTMGRGIAFSLIMKNTPVILYDRDRQMLKGASSFIIDEIQEHISKNRIPATEKENILQRIIYTSAISDCCAPLIIEAIVENADAKALLFQEIASINEKETLFATNTSSLSVTAIAEKTSFPEKITGLHFFNPAHRMKLVEVISTKYNSASIIEYMKGFVLRMGKTPVVCQDDPGFIVNHVARPFYLEALRLASGNVSDMETIDKLMVSAGFKMGPFHLMDLIGNDINYTVSRHLYEALGKPVRLQPSALQESMVTEGKLGRKTGNGFFSYSTTAEE